MNGPNAAARTGAIVLGASLAAAGLFWLSAPVARDTSVRSPTGGVAMNSARVAPLATADRRDLDELSVGTSRHEAARTAALSPVPNEPAEQPVAPAPPSYYDETVWTSGFQTQLDACRGAVDLTATYRVPVIGEKWECGGSGFPAEGSLVSLGGIMSGLYRVGPVVAVLSAYTDSAADIPSGYPLLYQTCRDGDAHTETFTELVPVG